MRWLLTLSPSPSLFLSLSALLQQLKFHINIECHRQFRMVTLNLLIQYCRVSCTKLYYYHRTIKMQNILLFANALNELCVGSYAKCEYNAIPPKNSHFTRFGGIFKIQKHKQQTHAYSASTCCPCNASYLWCNFRTSFHLCRCFVLFFFYFVVKRFMHRYIFTLSPVLCSV